MNGQPADWRCESSVGEPLITVEAPQADGATVVIRWDGTPLGELASPRRCRPWATYRAVCGTSSPAADVKLCEVHDPQQALSDIRTEAGEFSAKVTGELGHRTVFARLEQGTLSWWQPCRSRSDREEMMATAVDWEHGEVRLQIQNNSGEPVASEATASCGLADVPARLEIAPAFVFGRTASAGPRPGTRYESDRDSDVSRQHPPWRGGQLAPLGRGRVAVAGVCGLDRGFQ